MASPSLLLASLRGPPRPSSGQRGSACAASTWRTCGGAELHVQRGPAARTYVFLPRPDKAHFATPATNVGLGHMDNSTRTRAHSA
eukprot:12222572-Alexandrium_andersonii.AAC.1